MRINQPGQDGRTIQVDYDGVFGSTASYHCKISYFFDPFIFNQDALVVRIGACAHIKNAAGLDQYRAPGLRACNRASEADQETSAN